MMSDQNGIYITKKQASVCTAVFIVLGLLIFIVGYFWGKQSVIDGFAERASQESFNDKVDYMLTMQSYAEKTGTALPDELIEQKEDSELVEPEALAGLAAVAQEQASKKNEKSKKVSAKIVEPVSNKSYQAVLIGFGKKATAQQFAQRLQKRDITVEIKQKMGKTSSGKVARPWFQVVTQSFSSKQDLQDVVDRIVSLEKIKRSDVKII